MRTKHIRVLKPIRYWLAAAAVAAGLFFIETGSLSKSVGYGIFSASMKSSAIWLVALLWSFFGDYLPIHPLLTNGEMTW